MSCGHALGSTPSSRPAGAGADDDLQFQVYENPADDHEFVGGKTDFDSDDSAREPRTKTPDDDIRPDNSEYTGCGSAADPDFDSVAGSGSFTPDPADTDFSSTNREEAASATDPEEELTESGKIRRLSEDEVKSVTSSLYRKDAFLSDKDKKDLMQKLSAKDQLFTGSAPIAPPKRKDREKTNTADILAEIDPSIPSPKMAGRGRGIAIYYRNIIQLKGSQNLMDGDELVIAGRQYELRRKRVGQRSMMIGGGILFALVLIFFGSLLISDPNGQGRVAGIVYNEFDQPLIKGGMVRFPDLNQVYRLNGQGMFTTDQLPSGSHKIEVLRDGTTITSDITTVAGGEISLVILRPTGPQETTSASPESTWSPTTAAETPQAVAEPPQPTTTAAKPTANSPKPAAKPTGSTARLTLAANVDGAKVSLDGKVVGAGNLTFDRLTPGSYNYTVTKDGYQPATGRISLTGGETQQLAVTLSPLSSAQVQEQFTAEDYYFRGLSAAQERDFRAAIPDLEQAVKLDPGYADAHFALGDAHSGMKEWPQAHDSYLRAAEIYRFAKDYSRAITAYNEAIRTNDNSVPAYLGRGELFLQRNDVRAASVDFEQVVRLDKRNPQAYIGLGRARFTQGMYDQAIKHFKDARSLDSSNPIVYQYLMLCYMAESDYDEVRKSYEKFATIADEDQVRALQSDQRYSAVMRVVNGRQ